MKILFKKEILLKKIKISEYAATDKKGTSDLFKCIYKELGWKILPSEDMDNPIQFFDERNGWLLVAKLNGKVIGTYGLFPLNDGGGGIMTRFFISPDYRSRELTEKFLLSSREFSCKKSISDLVVDFRGTGYDERGIGYYESRYLDTDRSIAAITGWRIGSSLVALTLLLYSLMSDIHRRMFFTGLAFLVFIIGMLMCLLLEHRDGDMGGKTGLI